MHRVNKLLLRPYVQICSMLLVFLLFIVTASFKLSHPVFNDFKPSLEATAIQPTIKTGLTLQNFLTFDVVANQFIADVAVWFLIDPKKSSLADIAKFSFNKADIIEKNEPIIKEQADGNLFVRYDLRIKFSSNINYKYFPLDAHRIFLTLQNKYLDGNEQTFFLEPHALVIPGTVFMPGWQIQKTDGFAGLALLPIGNDIVKFPRVVFALDIVQDSTRDFIFIILPMLIILLLSLCAFGLKIRIYFDSVLNITTAGIAAILAYRYVIEKISPNVSYYLLCDHLFSLFLVLLFLIFFIDIFYQEKIDTHRGLIVMGMYGALVLGWLYLLFIW